MAGLALLWCFTLYGQAIQRKHLVTSLGMGAGRLAVERVADSATTTALEAGAVRFAVGYALGDRWSLGIHYDRIGSDRDMAGTGRLRVTTYLLEGSYRPWIGQRAAVELSMGFGNGIAVVRPAGARIPFDARGGVLAVGVRYTHLLSGTLGFFMALDHAHMDRAGLALDGAAVTLAEGDQERLAWSAQRLTTGLFLRF